MEGILSYRRYWNISNFTPYIFKPWKSLYHGIIVSIKCLEGLIKYFVGLAGVTFRSEGIFAWQGPLLLVLRRPNPEGAAVWQSALGSVDEVLGSPSIRMSSSSGTVQ
jgi:hypothetical protein